MGTFKPKKHKENIVDKVLKLKEFGSQVKLAEFLGVKQNTVSYWLLHTKEFPPEYGVMIFDRFPTKFALKDLSPSLFRRVKNGGRKST